MDDGPIGRRRRSMATLVIGASVALASCAGGTTVESTSPAVTSPPTLAPTTVLPPTAAPTTTTTFVMPVVTLPVPDAIEATPMTPDDTAAWVNRLPLPPDGFQQRIAIAQSGYGTFSISVPDGWVWWLVTFPPGDLAAVALEQDPEWGRLRQQIIEQQNATEAPGDGLERAAYADPESESLVVVTVALSEEKDLEADALAEQVVAQFESLDVDVSDVTDVPLPDGRYVEITVEFPATRTGWREDVVEKKAFILDSANGWLWSVTCNLHESIAEQRSTECTNIQRSLVVGGYVSG